MQSASSSALSAPPRFAPSSTDLARIERGFGARVGFPPCGLDVSADHVPCVDAEDPAAVDLDGAEFVRGIGPDEVVVRAVFGFVWETIERLAPIQVLGGDERESALERPGENFFLWCWEQGDGSGLGFLG